MFARSSEHPEPCILCSASRPLGSCPAGASIPLRDQYAEEGLQVDDAPNEALQGAGQVRGQVRYDLPRSWSGACSTLWRGMQFLMKLLRQKFLRIRSGPPPSFLTYSNGKDKTVRKKTPPINLSIKRIFCEMASLVPTPILPSYYSRICYFLSESRNQLIIVLPAEEYVVYVRPAYCTDYYLVVFLIDNRQIRLGCCYQLFKH